MLATLVIVGSVDAGLKLSEPPDRAEQPGSELRYSWRMRYIVVQLPDLRPALVVETASDAVASFEQFRSTLLAQGCHAGLIFDESSCIVVRDTYTSLDEASFIQEATLPTHALLGDAQAGSLDQRVADWLRRMAADWNHTLPKEAFVAPLLTDVVPALSGCAITEVRAA